VSNQKTDSLPSDVNILVERVRSGDQSAFSDLVNMYEPLIESLISKFYNENIMGLNKDDLRQEAILKFYKSILTYDTDQSDVEFGLYAKICVSNALISQARLQKKRMIEPSTESFDSLVESDPQDPSVIVLEEERITALYAMIRKNLSGYEYKIWQLYASGRTAKDIGSLIGTSEKSVNNAIYRIRKKLRAQLL